MPNPLRLVGLTGGIGSGKSTVARLIAARGIPVLDADQLSRAIVTPGRPAWQEIKQAWPDVLGSDGTIDRKRLGLKIFGDPAARKQLEAITHPRIAEECQQEAARLAAAGHKVAVYEASLLVETGRHRELDGLIVVTAPTTQQIARTMARDGLSEAEARARIAAQLPLATKLAAATYVIDNGGDLEATQVQVEALVEKLRA